MTDRDTAITAESDRQDWFTYQDLLDQIRAPLEHKYREGPWNGTYLPPMAHRSKTFSFEPLSLRVREIDVAAALGSVDHIHRALAWGYPNPDVMAADPDFTYLDMWGEWVNLARGDTFSFAALTHERDRELGCAYLRPTEDGTDPYETGLHIWTIEEGLRDDLDIALLEEFLAWIEAEWDFRRVVYYTPMTYQRGFDVADAVRLRRVDRKGPAHSQGGMLLTDRPTYAAFEWERREEKTDGGPNRRTEVEVVMTDQHTPINAESDRQDWFTYQDLLDEIKAPLEHKYSEGPWNGTYLPPMAHRSRTFSFEPLSLRVRALDNIAYMSSVDHIHRSLEWGFPNPDAVAEDPDFTYLDMWGEWVGLGRGDKFSFAGLTHERDRELGCAYLKPPVDGDDPYEAALQIWVIEEGLPQDLDVKLLREFLAWVEAEWAFDSVLYYTPEAYRRGLDIGEEVGLRRVDRKGPQPNYACFQWARP